MITYIIIFICIFQLIALLISNNSIIKLKNFIPDSDNILIKKYIVLKIDLVHDKIPDIITNINQYQEVAHSNKDLLDTVEIHLLEQQHESSEYFQKLINDINIYLVRNHNSIAEFNIINSLIERKLNELREEAYTYIYAPLYLGLIGTITCIVVSFIYGELVQFLVEDNVQRFLQEVGYTMFTSGLGLVFTTILAYMLLPKAIHTQEKNKNDLVSLLQIEIMPVINESMTDTFTQLQRSLLQFNSEFDQNTKRFFEVANKNADYFQKSSDNINKVVDKTYSTIEKQAELINTINNTKISDITQANLNIMSKLTLALEKFDKFTAYIDNLNDMLKTTSRIVEVLDKTLISTGRIHEIANHLDKRIVAVEGIIEFINTQLKEIEELSNTHKVMMRVSNETFTKFMNNLSAEYEKTYSQVIAIYQEISSKYQQDVSNTKQEMVETLNKLNNIIPETLQNVEKEFKKMSEFIERRLQVLKEEEAEMTNFLKKEHSAYSIQNLQYLEPISETQILLNKQLIMQLEEIIKIKELLLLQNEVQIEKAKTLLPISNKKIKTMLSKYSMDDNNDNDKNNINHN